MVYVLRQYEPNSNGERYFDRIEHHTQEPPRNTVLEVYYGPYDSVAAALVDYPDAQVNGTNE